MSIIAVICFVKKYAFYLCSIIPLIIRVFVMFYYKDKMMKSLPTEARDSDAYRGFIYAFLAISTAVLFALTISNAKSEIHLNNAVFAAVISFVGFYLSLSIQTYKFNILAEQIADGLLDNSCFALLLAVTAVLYDGYGLTPFSISLMVLIFIAYFIDFCIKGILNIKVLRG